MATGEPTIGRFRTAPADKRDVSFVWSGDTTGQGWGIDEARGGYLTYLAMLRHRPDFFMHSGDTIYADGPLTSEVKLPDGTLWRNVLTEEKSKAAETLAEFRGNYKYNLLDRNVCAFNAEVPIFAQWDDHEVTNNWSPSKSLESDKRYTEKSLPLLAARAARAAEEKIRIVLQGLRGEESIAELCRREGIASSMYYGWSKELLEAGKRRLSDVRRELIGWHRPG